MIASLITALYLMGAISAHNAATFLYITGVLLIIAEIGFTVFGILAFNGLLALFVGYAIQTGDTQFLGFDIDWSLLFGVAFIELSVVVVSAMVVLHYRKRKLSTGLESMVGDSAEIVEWKGQQGSVRVQGEIWKARAEQPLSLKKNEKVQVSAVDGLTLIITA